MLCVKLLEFTAVVLMINIPFGYWRGNTEKFTKQWFLAIHLPVLLTFVLRLMTHLPFNLETFLALMASFFFGQLAGRQCRSFLSSHQRTSLTSCLVMDVARRFRAG